ncbi:MAG: hypothetical protein EU532_11235 [Promethearchaeota archaeon]|nr:MAG: hypothetical protein EU532_11235 [Candidatus Lokiarchaeota archaeon]
MSEDQKPSLLIENLWVIENQSKLCVFEANYSDFTKDRISKDMVGSFLAALLTFAKESFTDEIQFIKFSNRKIVFKFSKHLLFVIAFSDKDINKDHHIKEISNEIVERFNEKFITIFENNNWNGNTTIFESFSEDLKEIVKREPLTIKFIEFLDIKEHFKKFESFIKKRKKHIIKNKEKIEQIYANLKKNIGSKVNNSEFFDPKYSSYNRFLR